MKRSFDYLSPLAVAVACAALFLLSETRAGAAGSQLLSGHVPAAVSRLQPLRHFDGTNHLKLAISLPLRDKEGLTNLLQQVYDPASPSYHHYLSAAQFAERFGPAATDYQTLKAFAASHNLALTGFHPNRTLLDVEGSVADIEQAFHTTMRVYSHPTESREFFAPDTEPSIDLDLPVLHVSGLDNFLVPRPMIHPSTIHKAGGSSALGSGPGGTYLGYDFRSAYVPGVALTGTGQTVALLEFESGFAPSDIASYETLANLPNVPVTAVLLDGYNGALGGANDEVSLDIEMAIAMAPGLNSVLVYEGVIADDILNRMATDNTAKQIGASWSGYGDSGAEQIFQQYAAQGQSFYNASGDGDAWVGTIYPPSDDPNITIVGGTTLSTSGPGGIWTSEKVWNSGYNPPGWIPGDDYWGSSGGISTVWPIPSWQLGINMVTNHGSSTMRCIPDVAMTADNIWITFGDGAAGSVGGTSCATPLWAGFTALVNQQAVANGESTQGFIAPAIYALAKGPSYNSCFHDIVLGDNTWTNSPTNFYAVPGYDLCTGWGTPMGSNLINALAPIRLTPILGVVTNIISGGNGNGIIDFDECNNLTIILTNAGIFAATGVQATIYSTTLGAIVGQGTSAYPTIYPSNTAPNLTYFTLSTEPTFVCGTPINLTMVVKSDQVVETNYIQLPSGRVGTPISFTNSTPLIIPTNFLPGNSSVQVSGLGSDSVNKITVSVFLAAQYDFGMTLQLTGPNGSNVMLSANNGNFGQNYGTACGSTNTETTFDDAAPVSILLGAAPFVGSYAPQQPLSVFNLDSGTNLNGTWTLQVTDDYSGDAAVLECWSLNVYPDLCVDGGGQCPGSDLSLTMGASPTTVFLGSNVVYTITVSNAGPSTAQNVVIVQGLPAGVTNVFVTNSTVSVSQSGSNLTMTLPSLDVYATATVSVSVEMTTNTLGANISTLVTSVASVGSAAPDPNPNNNTASATVVLSEPAADLAVSMTTSPRSVLQDGLLTYTISVTNNGPATAKGVTMSAFLPANATYVSATASQGTLISAGTSAPVANLGDIPLGTNVIVTIVISPKVTGNIVASATVALGFNSYEVDPILFNNTASVTTTVGPAADLGVTAFAAPSPVIAGSNESYIVTVSNAGPSTATGVVFSQTLPSGSTWTNTNSALPGSTISNGFITATIATLTNGGIVQFTNVVVSPTLLPGVKSQLMISTLSVFGQPGDPNTNNNSITLQTFAEPPTVTIVPAGVTVTSGSANGSVGTNGTYTVQFFLQNLGTVPSSQLVGALLPGNGVTSPSGPQNYGALAPEGASVGRLYSFTASSSNGGTIVATLQLTNNSTNLGAVSFTFLMPVVQTFSNTAAIYIPNPTNGQGQPNFLEVGQGYPYPSQIAVSGVQGAVSDVTVTISNIAHEFASDVGLLLVGPSNTLNPNGTPCVLMAAAGQQTAISVPVVLTFDQNASSQLPEEYVQIVPGTYQPSDYYTNYYGTAENYSNSLAPVGPYSANLSVFNNFSANGTWSLYAYDFATGDSGEIYNGWSLAITTITPVNLADLAATMISLTNSVNMGNNITNVWTVTNNGPNSTEVFVTNILSPGLTLVTNILPANLISSQSGQTNIFYITNLVPGTGVLVTNVVSTTNATGGLQTNTIIAGSALVDTNLLNNTAFAVTTVVAPPVDLALAPISVNPNTNNSISTNSTLVYTLYVTNNGPSNAFNVVGLFALDGVEFISGGSSAPYPYSLVNGSVQFPLGLMPAGSIAEVTVAAVPTSIGVITNVWSVLTSSSNTNSASNSVSIVLTVTNAMPTIGIGSVTLLSQNQYGSIFANQTNTVLLTLQNTGTGPTSNLVATLQAINGITPITLSGAYGAIYPGASVSQLYTFVGNGVPGAPLSAVWSLKDGTNVLGAVTNTFTLSMLQTFQNSSAIIIPDSGPATPYPSEIQVSGLTNFLVGKVTVTLNGFTHSWPHDVEAFLVSPSGQEIILMEHTGGPYAVSNLVLTFDSAVTASLPSNAPLSAGTFLPTEYTPFDPLPKFLPASSVTSFAAFAGTSPNGIWSLYVYDDTAGNDGVIAHGWSLNLTAVSPVNPTALLSVSSMGTPNPVYVGDYVSYQITVTNAGPGSATNVVLTDTTSNGLAVFVVTNNLGTIQANTSTNVTVQLIVQTNVALTNVAVATTATADLYTPPCTNIISTQVLGAAPMLSASLVGGKVQFTVPGYLGQNYAIQTSTNLRLWSNVSTNTGLFIYTNSLTNSPHRFYRAIQLPH